ncbi:MAG: FAD-binding oxidoreductase [Xanthobacteraceae bacterium]|nr:FAD-binding oxidoreductase [Xanthobacteraceae bacterium]
MLVPISDQTAAATEGYPGDKPRLTLDLDVEVCVVGGGLAGLTTAIEAARQGASVAVLEARTIGWNASGRNLGTVLPGFGVPVTDLIERVGLQHARELWMLSEQGGGYIRETVRRFAPDMTIGEGALEVSTTDAGDRLIGWLQTIGDLGTNVEGWQIDRVREQLRTDRYFHALHFPNAFHLDGAEYLRLLVRLAEQQGVRIFENTPVVNIDPAGIRKRIITPLARVRAGHLVLAGNVHIGTPAIRLASTLLPVWRYAALTEPLGDRLAEVIAFKGAVLDDDGIDHFHVIHGDRLLWTGPETTWESRPSRFARTIRRRIRKVFPQLSDAGLDQVWSASFGQTVHGMPQIGQLRPGLWVASGFGRQGLNTSAMGGSLIARAMLSGDDRWRLFSPFELVWAGGNTGRLVGQVATVLNRGKSAAAGTLARIRERASARERQMEQRRAKRVAAVQARTARATQASRLHDGNEN